MIGPPWGGGGQNSEKNGYVVCVWPQIVPIKSSDAVSLAARRVAKGDPMLLDYILGSVSVCISYFTSFANF